MRHPILRSCGHGQPSWIPHVYRLNRIVFVADRFFGCWSLERISYLHGIVSYPIFFLSLIYSLEAMYAAPYLNHDNYDVYDFYLPWHPILPSLGKRTGGCQGREHVVNTDCKDTCHMDSPELLARNQEGMDEMSCAPLGEQGIYLCRICRNKSRQKEPLSYGNGKPYMTITCRGPSLLGQTHVGSTKIVLHTGKERQVPVGDVPRRWFKREANMGLRWPRIRSSRYMTQNVWNEYRCLLNCLNVQRPEGEYIGCLLCDRRTTEQGQEESTQHTVYGATFKIARLGRNHQSSLERRESRRSKGI